MSTAVKTTPPGLRRILDAIGKLATEPDIRPSAPTPPPFDWRGSLIEGQRNVIKYYRRVLATQRMPPAEHQAVLDRISRIEEEIRALEARDAPPGLQAV